MQHVKKETRRRHRIRRKILERLAGRGRRRREYFRERKRWDVSVQDNPGADLVVVIDGPRHVENDELAAALDCYQYRGKAPSSEAANFWTDRCHTPGEGFRARTLAYLYD